MCCASRRQIQPLSPWFRSVEFMANSNTIVCINNHKFLYGISLENIIPNVFWCWLCSELSTEKQEEAERNVHSIDINAKVVGKKPLRNNIYDLFFHPPARRLSPKTMKSAAACSREWKMSNWDDFMKIEALNIHQMMKNPARKQARRTKIKTKKYLTQRESERANGGGGW